MGKAEATETVTERPSHDSHRAEDGPPDVDWTPGFMKQFPWLGAGALVGILLCTIASCIVLALSNNKSQNRWPDKVSPNVLINIFNSASGILLAIAIGNGVAIAWWRKTLNGATISDLHRSWTFSTSLKEIAFSLKYFNIIALATITAKLTIIDSTLMQKATWTEIRSDPAVPVNNIRGFAATDILPNGSPTAGGGLSGNSLFSHFKQDLQIWSKSTMLPNTFTGCVGQCYLELPAAGFAIECAQPTTQAIEYGNQTSFWTEKIGGTTDYLLRDTYKQFGTVQLFEIAFQSNLVTWPNNVSDSGSYLSMDMTWSDAPDSNKDGYCPGKLYRQSCKLKPSLISYPILIVNETGLSATNGIIVGFNQNFLTGRDVNSTDSSYNMQLQQQNGYKIIKPLNLVQNITYNDNNTFSDNNVDEQLAGLALGLQMYVGANATMDNFSGGDMIVKQGGNAANYLLNSPTEKQCTFRYSNPLQPDASLEVDTIIQRINEITFALATDISGKYFTNQVDKDAKVQSYSATVYGTSVHYLTNFGYLAGAAASTLLCIMLVMPSYWGFWQLGRKVTLGPLEIAHAFRSPMTAQAKNGTLDDMLKEVGENKIQYGHIVAGDAKGVVGVAEPEYVAQLSSAPRRTTQ